MENIWNSKFNFTLDTSQTASTHYIVDDRLNIFEDLLLDNHDVHFKNQSCLNGVSYSYIKELNNICDKSLLTGDENAINNMYNEYNIIDKHLKNLYHIDIAIGGNNPELDLESIYFQLDNISLKENHTILVYGQYDKSKNNIYRIEKNKLVLSNILDKRENSINAKIYIKLGTNKEKQFFLLNESRTFPTTDENKDFKEYTSYILKNEINYDINTTGKTSILFTNYDLARHLQDNTSTYSELQLNIKSTTIILLLSFSTSTVFTLNINATYSHNATVNWGDGSVDINVSSTTNHTYAAGDYYLVIENTFESLNFENEQNIKEIISWGNDGGLKYINFKNSSLEKIPEETNKLTEVLTFEESFMGTLLTYIPIHTFNGNYVATNDTAFTSTFENCTGLTNIQDIFYDNDIRVFDSTFKNCNIDTISETLFINQINLSALTNTFEDNNIVIIPEDIFKYNINLVYLDYVFSNNDIVIIPTNLLKHNTLLTNVKYLFQNNFITRIFNDLFIFNTQMEYFNGIFKGNPIIFIENTLFDSNKNVIDFSETFMNTTIEYFPDLFVMNKAVEKFDSTFENCININEIHNELFMNNHSVISFDSTFKGCEMLHIIQETIFNTNVAVISFANTFQDCIHLEQTPLFNYNELVDNFTETFKNCSNLNGNAPKLWDVNYYSPIKESLPTLYNDCFYNTGNLGSGGQTIPICWGGFCSCDCLTGGTYDCDSNCDGS